MEIKVNATYVIEIGSTKVQLSKFDMIKLRDKLNEELGTGFQNTTPIPTTPWIQTRPWTSTTHTGKINND